MKPHFASGMPNFASATGDHMVRATRHAEPAADRGALTASCHHRLRQRIQQSQSMPHLAIGWHQRIITGCRLGRQAVHGI